jgi:hypothetical protein
MSTTTQYNPSEEHDERLLEAGGSKTVYALVTPESEAISRQLFSEYETILAPRKRAAWTKKQDSYHVEFFDRWVAWSAPVINFDRELFPFFYPGAGSSEILRHLIYSMGVRNSTARLHVFKGEYEGYKAVAEAARIKVVEWDRDDWQTFSKSINRVQWDMREGDLFFISQPSGIDGNVWSDFNEFLSTMDPNTVVVDLTYVGAIPAVKERFDLTLPSVRNVVFSLSKPFGLYYNRIGGVWSRKVDPGLYGNVWFKNLDSLALGVQIMDTLSVWDLPRRYSNLQRTAVKEIGAELGIELKPCDVFILGQAAPEESELSRYVTRTKTARICLTPYMSEMLGTDQ